MPNHIDFSKNPYSVSTEGKPRTQPHKAQNKACNQLECKRTSNIPQTHKSRLNRPKNGKLRVLKILVNSCRFSSLWHGTCINWNEPAMQKRNRGISRQPDSKPQQTMNKTCSFLYLYSSFFIFIPYRFNKLTYHTSCRLFL